MSYKVINIGGKVVNNYVLVTEHGCVAIDTGYAGGFEEFSCGLLKNNISLSDIKYVFLTHAHDDHAGFLKELLDASGARVILHRDAVDRLKKGQNPFNGGCTSKTALLFCKVLALFGKGKHLFPPTDVSGRYIIADQGDRPLNELGIDARVMLLPGHTLDSIGLLLDDEILLCGDVAMSGPGIVACHPIWVENLEYHRKTWDVIISSGIKVLYPGHGKPLSVADLKRFRHYMDGKKLYPLKEY